MEFALWIALGYIIGWVGPEIMNSNVQRSMLTYLFLGISGALSGGFVTYELINNNLSNFNYLSVIIATLGALAFIRLGKRIDQV